MSHRIATTLAILLVASARLAAQSSEPTRDRGWLVATSVGVPGNGSETEPRFFTVGVQFTDVRIRRLSPDISIGTVPYALVAGVAVIGLRAGGAVPFALGSHVLMLPSAGMSVVGGAGPGGGGGTIGINGGLATVLLATSKVGLRVGATIHQFPEARGAMWLAEIGIASIHAP